MGLKLRNDKKDEKRGGLTHGEERARGKKSLFFGGGFGGIKAKRVIEGRY